MQFYESMFSFGLVRETPSTPRRKRRERDVETLEGSESNSICGFLDDLISGEPDGQPRDEKDEDYRNEPFLQREQSLVDCCRRGKPES